VDSSVVKNAVGALDKLLSQTKRAVWEVEREVYGWSSGLRGRGAAIVGRPDFHLDGIDEPLAVAVGRVRTLASAVPPRSCCPPH